MNEVTYLGHESADEPDMIINYIELTLIRVLRFKHIVIILIVNNIEQPIIVFIPLWIIYFIILISPKPIVIE